MTKATIVIEEVKEVAGVGHLLSVEVDYEGGMSPDSKAHQLAATLMIFMNMRHDVEGSEYVQ